MKIQALPQKEQITFFNAQYYHNVDADGKGTKGKAKHVLVVTYSTHPEPYKAKHSTRKAKFYLRDENKEINRLTRKHLSEEESEAIKQRIKTDKKQSGTTTWFGFRIQEYKLKDKYVKDAVFNKRETDPNNCVFFRIPKQGNISLMFVWEGQVIEVEMTNQVNPVERQSLAYAYWTNSTTQEQLEQRIKELKNDTEARSPTAHAQSGNDASLATSEGSNESSTEDSACTDTRATSGEASEEGTLQSQEGSGRASVQGEDQHSESTASRDELAEAGWVGEADSMGINDQKPTAKPFSKRQERASTRIQQRATDFDNPLAGTAYDPFWMVDRQPLSPFAAEPTEQRIGLGTTFRF